MNPTNLTAQPGCRLLQALNRAQTALDKGEADLAQQDLHQLEVELQQLGRGDVKQRIESVQTCIRVAQETYDAIARRLHSLATSSEQQPAALQVATAYLRTQPPAPFHHAFLAEFGELAELATASLEANTDLLPLTQATKLHSALFLQPLEDLHPIETQPSNRAAPTNSTEPTKQAAVHALEHPLPTIITELHNLRQRPDCTHLVYFGLQSANLTTAATAASLAASLKDLHSLPALLSMTLTEHVAGLHAAVFAAMIDPEYTLQMLGKLLADAAYEPQDDPNTTHSPSRARTLIVARALIPRIGSPLVVPPHQMLPPSVALWVQWVDTIWNTWSNHILAS